MSNESRNSRTICFRVDAEEYERFRQLCIEQGTGNLSEMARAGLKMILSQPSIAHEESLSARVAELETRLRLLFREVRKLNPSRDLCLTPEAVSAAQS